MKLVINCLGMAKTVNVASVTVDGVAVSGRPCTTVVLNMAKVVAKTDLLVTKPLMCSTGHK